MEAGPSKRKETMMKEATKSVAELKALPVEVLAELKPWLSLLEQGFSTALPIEVLVKIFNFLPNHDIRCGVSLVCKNFTSGCPR